MLYFFLWSFGFWPILIGCEYAWTRSLERTSLIGNSEAALLILALVWIVGMVNIFRLHRWQNGMSYNNVEKPTYEVLYIVEAPSDEHARITNANYIESEATLSKIPVTGKRLVLNEDNDDDSDILGTVVEVAEGTHEFSDGRRTRIWIELDRPDDFENLAARIGWDEGFGEKRRSSTTEDVFA